MKHGIHPLERHVVEKGEMIMNFEQTVQALMEAIKQRDIDRLLAIASFDEDMDFVLYTGVHLHGRPTIMNLHTVWFSDPEWQFEPQIVRTVETPEMAYAFIHLHYSDASLSYSSPHHLCLIFVKKDGKWSLIHDQSTVAVE
jgi:uncharacterized protein (TIGR02246 family)